MKKILMLLLMLSIAVMFMACSTDEMDVKVKKLPKGAANYDFEGISLTYTDPDYVYLEKNTAVVSGTTTTNTKQMITIANRTYTLVFNEDATFTYTDTITYQAGMDATYTNDSATGVSYVAYNFNLLNFNNFDPTQGFTVANSHSGFNGQVFRSYVYSGTWETYEKPVSDATDQTLVYILTFTQRVATTKTFTYGTVDYASALTGTSITTDTYTEKITELNYEYVGEDANGNAKYDISTDDGTISSVIPFMTVQPE